MQLLPIVKSIEGTDKQKRLQAIISYLKDWDVDYTLHRYESGVNLVIPFYGRRWIGVSCHYDVVPGSPGANDNASAIAVCLEILRRCLDHEP